jgi:hypothetical protein
MVRRLLLVVMAVGASFGLTALAGYLLYTNSTGRPEPQLSEWVRFICNPLIAVLVGGLVGALSKNRPIATTVVGLVPWLIMLIGSSAHPQSLLSWIRWLGPIFLLLPLSCIGAACVARNRGKASQHLSVT